MSRYDPPRGGERWDRARLGAERERYERGPYRAREVSVDDVYSRRGPRGGFEEQDHYRYEEFDRERAPARPGRDRGFTIEKEREREFYTPEAPSRRPGMLRRQSSLDTFDRKPFRFSEREEFGPPARYYGPPREDDSRPGPPPLTPVRRQLMAPSRRYDPYDDIESVADDDFRGYPERIREREIIRRRRRSKDSSKPSRRSNSKESRSTHSTQSAASATSDGSSSGSSTTISVRSEFPKKGKTRMPARLVSKRAIIDLGYPFEEEGDVIIIQKALGSENIDEVIKLSEDYFKSEKHEMSGGRSDGGGTTVISERKTEVFQMPGPPQAPAPLPPPPGGFAPPPGFRPPPPPGTFMERSEVKETRISEQSRSPSPSSASSYHSRHTYHSSHHNKSGPVILEAKPRDESAFMARETIVERSEPMPVGPLALAVPAERRRMASGGGERDIRERIKYLELEKEALKAERRAERELRKTERSRKTRESSSSHHSSSHHGGEMVVYDRESEKYSESGYGERDVTVVKRESRLVEPEGGVRIEKDRKGPPPKVIRAMLATLT